MSARSLGLQNNKNKMKHIKLFEDFLNEAKTLKPNEQAIALGILMLMYAIEGTEEGDALEEKGLHPNRSNTNVDQMVYLSAWGKDVVKHFAPGSRVGSEYMLGNVVTVAANNGNTYYFDDVDFVENDKTIIRDAMRLDMRDLVFKLIEMGIISLPQI